MLILTGHSASGKTEIVKLLVEKYDRVKMVTYTTRPPRKNEINGIDYNFITINDFLEKKKNDSFIEVVNYNGNYYGTLKSDIKDNKVVILEPNGVNHFYKELKNAVTIIYIETSIDFRIKMMRARGDDIEDIKRRIASDEILFQKNYFHNIDYVVMNDENYNLVDIATKIYAYSGYKTLKR